MATTTSKSNETASMATDPSTAVPSEERSALLRKAEEQKEAYRQKQEAQFVAMMGETAGKAYAAKVWAKMWDEDYDSDSDEEDSESEDEEDGCCATCRGEFGEECAFASKKDPSVCRDCYLNAHLDEDDEEDDDEYTCCLCEGRFTGYGNNARPLAEGTCCDGCNEKVVVTRMAAPSALAPSEVWTKDGEGRHISEEQYERMKEVTSKWGGQTSDKTWTYASQVMGATGDHHETFNMLWTAMSGVHRANRMMNDMRMEEKHSDARERLRRKLEARKAQKK